MQRSDIMETEIIFNVILFSISFYLPLALFFVMHEYVDVTLGAFCSMALCVFLTHKLCAPVPKSGSD